MLARDRFGKKPLYYHQRPGELIFASTLTALLAHPRVPRALDDGALAEYLGLEYVVAPRTILRDVHKLPPHALVATAAARGVPYWTLRVGGGHEEARAATGGAAAGPAARRRRAGSDAADGPRRAEEVIDELSARLRPRCAAAWSPTSRSACSCRAASTRRW